MLNKNIIEGIFDSGANISCVSLNVIQKLNIPIWKYKNEKLNFKTITNTEMYLCHSRVE